MKSELLFSVIIPTYHRNELLLNCLKCLTPKVQALHAEQYEIIVTDDGSQTTAEEMIRENYPWVSWVSGPRRGPAANRNNGAQFAQGSWLVFTDDDCLPDQNWLSALEKAVNGQYLALEGAIHPLGNVNEDLAECPINLFGGCFWSANIAVQKNLFNKVGGFDPKLRRFNEDQDLKLRLLPFTKIQFLPEAKVTHPVRRISLEKKVARIPNQCHDYAYYMQKNREFLGCKSNFNIILYGLKIHLKATLYHCRNLHLKAALGEMLLIAIGVPVIYINLINKKEKDFV